MSFVGIMGKLYMRLTMNDNTLFKYNREEDESFIKSLPEPNNDIERSYNQYLCQKRMDSSPLRYFVSNVISFFVLVPLSIFYRLNEKQTYLMQKYDAILTRDFIKNMLPDNYNGTYVCQDFNKGSLNSNDILFLKKIRSAYPFAFYFRFKCLNRIAAYSNAIKMYSPKIVFCSAEYSFTSSVLTEYCEMRGVEHINIMHGEKLYMPRDAFSRFTYFYVWDEHYIELFKSLKADKTKYIVTPMKVSNIATDKDNNKCVYYLGLETVDELKRIKKSLEELGKDFRVRPHPVYETKDVRQIFEPNQIEEPEEIDIWESISKAGMVVSLYSTVLYQAYLKNIPIMIDDLSKPELYHELKDRDYIMLEKPHMLMSEELKKRIM